MICIGHSHMICVLNAAQQAGIPLRAVTLKAVKNEEHLFGLSRSLLIEVASLDGVHYFPAYEIVIGNFSRGRYFTEDLRSIAEPGVEHVMSLFFRHATSGGGRQAAHDPAPAAPSFARDIEKAVDVLCDEELLTLDVPSLRERD